MRRNRTKIEREADLSKIGSLLLQGLSQREIAAAVGLSQPQVGREVRKIQERWAKSDPEDLRKIRRQEIMKFDELERVAWAALRDSCRDKETRCQEKVTAAKPENASTATERLKASLRTEGREGNPQYMKVILDCIDRRAKLRNLYDPRQIQSEPRKPLQIMRVMYRNGQEYTKPEPRPGQEPSDWTPTVAGPKPPERGLKITTKPSATSNDEAAHDPGDGTGPDK